MHRIAGMTINHNRDKRVRRRTSLFNVNPNHALILRHVRNDGEPVRISSVLIHRIGGVINRTSVIRSTPDSNSNSAMSNANDTFGSEVEPVRISSVLIHRIGGVINRTSVMGSTADSSNNNSAISNANELIGRDNSRFNASRNNSAQMRNAITGTTMIVHLGTIAGAINNLPSKGNVNRRDLNAKGVKT